MDLWGIIKSSWQSLISNKRPFDFDNVGNYHWYRICYHDFVDW